MTVLRIKSSLHQRPESSNLFFRKVIPAELRPCFGKREIKYSFKTADPVTARSHYYQISACVERQLANARAQLLGTEEITDLLLQKLADEWYSLARSGADSGDPISPLSLHQFPGGPRKSPSFLNLDSCPRANSLNKLERALGMDARSLLLHHGIALNHKSSNYHQLLILLAEKALLIKGHDPVEPQPQSTSIESKETPTLQDIWDRFEALYSASDNPQRPRQGGNLPQRLHEAHSTRWRHPAINADASTCPDVSRCASGTSRHNYRKLRGTFWNKS